MIAEVIAIGDELTSGQRLDTNSQWLSRQLGDLGVRVVWHTTIGDDLPANVEALRQAARRADVVVTTGGLGPTADDLTREALARVMDAELVLDEAALEHIRGIFTRRGREMPANNRVQAMFPAGSRIIPNPHGTAPGIAARLPRDDGKLCHLFALPGVPAEMWQMWAETVVDEIVSLAGTRRVIHHHRIKCFGAGESQIELMLPDLVRRGRIPSVGITASDATITLRITATGETVAECQGLIAPTIETIRQCLGSLVYGQEDEELEHVVSRLLAEQNKTIATVEAGTGGMIAGRLQSAGGGTFVGGLVVDEASVGRLLDLPAANSAGGGSLSQETIAAWAIAGQKRMAADVALAVGPFHETGEDTPGDVLVALATDEPLRVRSFSLAGHPAIQKPRLVKQSLNWVRLVLTGRGKDS